MARRRRQVRGDDPQGRLLAVSNAHGHARHYSTAARVLANDRINNVRAGLLAAHADFSPRAVNIQVLLESQTYF